ncbi:MAG: Bacterial regulatory protein luxR family, partial [Verrucomicrobiota bacterium]
GFGTSEIARRLRVSVSSIESYRAGIKRKLELKNSAQLVHAAVTRVVSRGQLSGSASTGTPRGSHGGIFASSSIYGEDGNP